MNAADVLLPVDRIAQDPGRVAILHRERSISYGALLAEVNRFANGLRAIGVEREQRVMLMLRDTPSTVALLIAAMKIGAVAVPVNVRASPAELALMLADARAKVIALDGQFLPTYEAIGADVSHDHRVYVTSDEVRTNRSYAPLARLASGQSDQALSALTSPDDMAFWLYTSGTTGTPKAAVHLHHDIAIADAISCEALGLRPDDRIYTTSRLFFAYSLGQCLFPGLKLGASCVIDDEWPESARVADVVDRHAPTVFLGVPTLYRNLLRDGVATGERFRSVRLCVSAGERLPAVLFDRWRAATGVEILDGIGTTETIYLFLVNRPGKARAGSSGTPVAVAEVELRDAEGTRIDAPDSPGVLWVKIESSADRYWNQQARSRAAFVGPWFRTGDVYRRDRDGYYYHEGRADDMLKISGQWVSPAEIEEQVLRMPLVADAAVVGMANADGLTRLALFIVPHERSANRTAIAATIQTALVEHLAIYKCPREIRLVEDIPRTATGKVQRFKLRASLSNP